MASAQADAYKGRESISTRNPHVPSKVLSPKELARLNPEERVFAQWKASYGTPISDEAKAQFRINACDQTYNLADVRLWTDHHKQKNQDSAGIIFLEFFFDGSPDELTGQEDQFKKAFEAMVEKQLQEVRLSEFRKKLSAATRQRKSATKGSDDGVEGGGGAAVGDEDWREYLKKPVPATNLSIRSMREAGCMLKFLVCQTSISVSAAEVLGQIAFQEHFPIDGVAQEPSKSTKPLPRWIYGMLVCTVGFTTISVLAWWQIVKTIMHRDGSDPELLST